MYNNNRVAKAIRLAMMVGVSATVTISVSAFSADEINKKTTANTQLNEDFDSLEEETVERISVTGSRIRRAEFSSASPIQVISGDISRETGVFDTASMLQNTTQASGQQIDSSFGGFVLDNGPGSSTIGFRGLGAARTLTLVNGKRMVNAGVGGAPVSPDLNLIPSVMIDRIENLFDGASTVYGSDAIAGVANAILKSDVEGFDIEASYKKPKSDGAEETTLSLMYGKTFDNGFITVGAEYYDQKSLSLANSRFTNGCNEIIYETRDGRTLNQNRTTGPLKDGFGPCDIFPLTNRVSFGTFWGSLYSTPGSSNTGVPNFSETTIPLDWVGLNDTWIGADSNGDGIIDTGIVDGNGDGYRDVSFRDPFWAYSLSNNAQQLDLVSQNKRYSFVINGEYNFEDNNDTHMYYDVLWAKRETPIYRPGGQQFPTVSATNPFNPCGTNGVDCGKAVGFETGPVTAQPIFNIRGDRDSYDVEVSQARVVTGVTGNLALLDNFGAGNWFYDVYVSYAESKGIDKRQGIYTERFHHSLETSVLNDDGSITCGDGSDGCVPVNLFADNIFQEGGGNFTQAEADYLFVERYIETNIEQTVVSGFISGDIYTLPWNNETIAAVLGTEYRKDKIGSKPNEVASEGLLENYFTDKGAVGSRSFREVFAEFDAPLLRGQKYAEELTVTVSGRITEESYYDAASTYSIKGVYRPVEWVTLRGTQGTSFRAPNLRERFISGTSGFTAPGDVCVVPEVARIVNPNDPNGPKGYDPTKDTRKAYNLSACVADGVDPLTLGNGVGDDSFLSTYSVESETSGDTILEPETSISKTYGFVIEQPFSEDFDLTFSLTKFDIEITNGIVEPDVDDIINGCYNDAANPQGSDFCDRITRGTDGNMVLIEPGFINVGFESSKGYDYNLFYQQDFLILDNNLDVSLDLNATKVTEQAFDILDDADDNLGEIDTPEWRASARLRLAYEDFSFNWNTRFIGGGEMDEEDRQEWDTEHDACTGLIENGEKVECRAVASTDDYIIHDASIRWAQDNYSITLGFKNVFDKAPPRVDSNDGSFNIRNTPAGVGYDLYGRSAFLAVQLSL
jgi:iron complex outermembrane receptor protein